MGTEEEGWDIFPGDNAVVVRSLFDERPSLDSESESE